MFESSPRERDQDDEVPTVASDEPSDDTSGGPLSSGAGEGSGREAPDVDAPGGADDEGGATEEAVGGS